MKLITIILITLCISKSYAQTSKDSVVHKIADTTKAESTNIRSDKSYPRLSLVNIQWDQFGKTPYTFKYHGNEVDHGNLLNNRFQVNAAVPISLSNNLTLIPGLVYTREAYTFSDVISNTGFSHDNKETYNNLDFSIKADYVKKLFGKPLISSVDIYTMGTGLNNVKRIGGDIKEIMLFPGGLNTKYTFGFDVPIDPSSFLPVIPIAGVWHRFNDNWEMDILILKKAALRRANTLGGWASIGAEFNINSYFVPGNQVLHGTYEERYNEFNGYLAYDRMLSKRIMIGIRGGYKEPLDGKLLPIYAKKSDYIGETATNSKPFFGFHLSYVLPNPQVFKKIKKGVNN